MTEHSLEQKFVKATEAVCKQGVFPFPVNDTTIEIMKIAVGNEEAELDFIDAFKEKASQTLAELKASSNLPESRIDALASSLAKKGLLFNQPSSSGAMVYRLLPLMNVGLMEYLFMGPLRGDDRERRLAELFERLLEEVKDGVQANYDQYLPLFEAAPPVDRTVPMRSTDEGKSIGIIAVDKTVEVPDEFVLPSQSVEDIISKFDDIAVGHCFCRQRQKTLGNPCATDAPTLNCFTFGKSARHTAGQGFAKMISREEALEIMKEAEAAGLVHKAFHPGSRTDRPETSICNCCKDCCDTLNIWRSGSMPLINSTYYLSVVDPDACTGCGTCEEKCPTEAIRVSDDGTAEVNGAYCFGCGVCARFCPEEAISLKEGLRKVFVPPPRMRQGA